MHVSTKLSVIMLVLMLSLTAQLASGFLTAGTATATRSFAPASPSSCTSAPATPAVPRRRTVSRIALFAPDSFATATANATEQRLRLAALLAVKASAAGNAAVAPGPPGWLSSLLHKYSAEQRVLATGVIATLCVGVLGGVSFGSALCAVAMLV
jgi:hypothetical protein